MLEFIVSQIPGTVFGTIGGAIGMFFIARKNPKWVQDIYEKQKGITSDVRKELEEAKAKLARIELKDQIVEILKELKEKV